MNPKVSVIIPTYNRAHVLKRAMDSVLSQEEVELELIVVDDGSTDETKELVSGYQDERVRYIRAEKNGGPARARNLGAKEAKGDFIAFQDSDDEWRPLKLKKQLELFEGDGTGAGMVYCCFQKKFPDREIIYPPQDMPKEMKSGQVFETLLFRPLVGTPTMLIPKAVWQEIEGFNEELRCFEDWELTMRIAKRYPILLLEEPLVNVYFSGESLITDSVKAIEADFCILQKYFTYYHTDEMKKEKLNQIAARVRTEADFDAYRRGMQEVFHVNM